MLLLWYTPPNKGVPKYLPYMTRRREIVQAWDDEEVLLLAWWIMLQGDKTNG